MRRTVCRFLFFSGTLDSVCLPPLLASKQEHARRGYDVIMFFVSQNCSRFWCFPLWHPSKSALIIPLIFELWVGPLVLDYSGWAYVVSNQDPQCTQKPIYTPIFTHHIRSSLLCTPANSRFPEMPTCRLPDLLAFPAGMTSWCFLFHKSFTVSVFAFVAFKKEHARKERAGHTTTFRPVSRQKSPTSP